MERNMKPKAGLVIADMIKNPEKYGFKWGYGPLSKDGTQIIQSAPRIEHMDIDLLRDTFGDEYFYTSMNGQSARVRDQTLREELWGNIPLRKSDEGMKQWVLEKALGQVSRKGRVTVIEKEVEVYIADDGTKFKGPNAQADVMAYNVDLKLALQDAPDEPDLTLDE